MPNKSEEYAQKLVEQIGGVFERKDGISLKELSHPDNFTAFMHALATMAPLHYYNILAKKDMPQLDFNHMANALVVQEAKREAVKMSKS